MKKIYTLILTILFFDAQAFCVFDPNTQWEIRSTASAGNRNGACFVLGASGTDYSQQDNPQYIIGGITSAGAGNVLLSTSAASDWVGNGCYSIGGTNIYPERIWQISAVTPGVDFTVLSTGSATMQIATGVVVDGAIRIGGAASLNSSVNMTDDALLECAVGSNTIWVKAGVYSIPGTIGLTSPFVNFSTPCWLRGYTNVHGDDPEPSIISTSPLISLGPVSFTTSLGFNVSNIAFSGTGTTMFLAGANTKVKNVSFYNASGSAGRPAFGCNGGQSNFRNIEAVSIAGIALSVGNFGNNVFSGLYLHDSNVGIKNISVASYNRLENSVISSCIGGAIIDDVTSANFLTNRVGIKNCTLYGFKNINVSTLCWVQIGSATIDIENCIFANGYKAIMTDGFFNNGSYLANNSFHNFVSTFSSNFASKFDFSRSSFVIGVDPTFDDDSEIYAATAATNGTVLMMHGGGFFANSGITDTIDFLNYHSGTAGSPIATKIIGHSSFSVTLAQNIGTSANQDHVFTIKKGKKFGIGANLRGKAYPYKINGSSTTSFNDIGAVQHQDVQSVGGSSGFFIQ